MTVAEQCPECLVWQSDQMATGAWDEFTVVQARLLIETHHLSHDWEAKLDGLLDDDFVEIKVGTLRELLAANGEELGIQEVFDTADQILPPPIDRYVPPPAADGHPHKAKYRQRCNPPEPGFVDEVCGCGTPVRIHIVCPHPGQRLERGAVSCNLCDYVFVKRSGVVGEEQPGGGVLKREDTDWNPEPGGTNAGTNTFTPPASAGRGR